jgi:hypothetical protein
MNPQTLTIVITVLVILPLLYFRISRSMRPQRLKPGNLWIRPAIMIFAAGSLLMTSPPQISEIAWFVVAVALGGGGGWYWGKLTNLHVHPENGTLMSTGSQAGMIVLVLLIVFRLGMRAGIGMEAGALHVNAALIADVSIVFAASLFSVRGLEIFLRARQMLKPPG